MPRRRILGAAVVLPALVSRVAGDLVVTAPPELAGLRLLAGAYAFAPVAFDVDAQLVLTARSAWDYSACPPALREASAAVNNASLHGRIVVHDQPDLGRCSAEMHSRGAAREGAVAWLAWLDDSVALGATPGRCKMCWVLGDSRESSAGVAAEITQRAGEGLLASLRAGARVHARVRPSATRWDRMRSSPALVAWQALVALNSLELVELAACHLYAFVREDGGLRANIAHVMMLVQILAGLVRVALGVVDPLWSRGTLDVESAALLLTLQAALGLLGSALFLVYLGSALDTGGLASLQLRPAMRQPSLIFATAVLAATVCAGAALYAWHDDTTERLRDIGVLLVCPLLMLVPSYALVRSLSGSRSTQRLPVGVGMRLRRRMRQVIGASVASVLLAALLLPALHWPYVLMVATLLYVVALNGTGYVQTYALHPVSTRVPKLPLHWLRRRTWRLVRRACGATADDSHSAHPATPPRLSENSRSVRPSFQSDTLPPPLSAQDSRSLRQSFRSEARVAPQQPSPPRSRRTAPVALSSSGEAVPLVLGVSRRFLGAFAAEHGITSATSTHEVGKVVRALTAEAGTSFAQLHSGALADDGSPAVAEATIFVSHAQQCAWAKLLDAIDLHAEMHSVRLSDVYVWLDVLSLRQSDVASDVKAIGDIQAYIGRTVIVLDPWHSPLALTRAWCLFEIASSQLYDDVELHITMDRAERAMFLRALQADRRVVESVLARFDARDAHASVEEDKRMIDSLIHGYWGGDGLDAFNEFNELVRTALFRALPAFSWQVQ